MFEVVQGEGLFFMGPDADKARDFFRHKERALANKVMSVKEAVDLFIRDDISELMSHGRGAPSNHENSRRVKARKPVWSKVKG